MYNIHSKLEANTYQNGDVSVTLKKGKTQISPEQLEQLTSNEVFKLHQANGFVTIEDAEDDPEDNPPELKGSSKQPEDFTLEDDTVVTLEAVILEAFTQSGLTHDEWNELKNAAREKLIKAVVDALPQKEA